ncbi:hypothetical protein H5410_018522 [Solanum commersonii]|uniref:Uncharacterized protein n=1 Tax=Solanum commersonii TaxID=4109 RepID=A0A9J6A2Z8_SOLCO|nr:hypothetical protein H5410_018522 [Solanum commersonii]
MLLDPTPSEALTSHPPSTTEASDDERGKEAINVTTREEWVSRVEVTRQAVEILGQRMNEAPTSVTELRLFLGLAKYNRRVWSAAEPKVSGGNSEKSRSCIFDFSKTPESYGCLELCRWWSLNARENTRIALEAMKLNEARAMLSGRRNK